MQDNSCGASLAQQRAIASAFASLRRQSRRAMDSHFDRSYEGMIMELGRYSKVGPAKEYEVRVMPGEADRELEHHSTD